MTIEREQSAGVAAVYRLLRLDPPTLTRLDIERRTSVPHERTLRWWRAMGLPEMPAHEVAFRDEDVEMVRRLDELLGEDVVDEGEVLRLARLMGASFSRLVEAQLEVIDELFTSPDPDGPLHPRRIDERALAAAADTDIVETLESTLLYVWRRHLLAAIGHRLTIEEEHTEQAVGFADLSGFTRVSKKASSLEIAHIIETFEGVAFDVVSSHRGRIVKLIGDEVMFVTLDLDAAVSIGLDLINRLEPLPNMPGVHAGIAYGPTVTVGGDVFGPTVNLASRLTDVARRNTVAVPRALADRLEERGDVDMRRIRRSYDLKGVGRTEIMAIRPR
ncbi:MAG: adenylate/guanylate cyclase domain-containing protein [Acidimicrobiia bacterium]|nr:adenylate/guanylate cyclase domain-containing protein [Acidimicrobiia bacterium]